MRSGSSLAPSSSGFSERPLSLSCSGALARSSTVGTMSTCWTIAFDPAAGAFAGGRLDDQRDSERFLVSEHAVPGFAVIAEPFAVIGRQDDRRLVVELVRFEVLDEAADELVDVRNLAVVRLERIEPRWRRVRRVRFVEVQEQERPLGAGLFQPALPQSPATSAPSRDRPPPGSPGVASGMLAVEERKALGDAGRRPQRVTDDTTPAVA